MDKDQTGTIDWWEFLNHEALKIISKNRSKVGKTLLSCKHAIAVFTSSPAEFLNAVVMDNFIMTKKQTVAHKTKTHHNTVWVIGLSRKLMKEKIKFKNKYLNISTLPIGAFNGQ